MCISMPINLLFLFGQLLLLLVIISFNKIVISEFNDTICILLSKLLYCVIRWLLHKKMEILYNNNMIYQIFVVYCNVSLGAFLIFVYFKCLKYV